MKTFLHFSIVSLTLLCSICGQVNAQTDDGLSMKNLTLEKDDDFELSMGNLECRKSHGSSSSSHHHHHHSSTAAYGSFFSTEPTTVAPSAPIIFNQASVETAGVNFRPDGSIVLQKAGDYLVEFGASAIDLARGVPRIALALDGVFPQSGSNIDTDPSGQILASAATIVHVKRAPAILTLVNYGNDDIALNSPVTGNVNAFVSVEKLSRRRAAYGSFYTQTISGDATSIVNPESPIIFGLTSVATPNVKLLSGGIIEIDQAGDYLVNMGATPFKSSNPQIGLALNGVFPQPGTNVNIFMNSISNSSTIIHVTETPSFLTVVNTGINVLNINAPINGDVSAFITINKLQDIAKFKE